MAEKEGAWRDRKETPRKESPLGGGHISLFLESPSGVTLLSGHGMFLPSGPVGSCDDLHKSGAIPFLSREGRGAHGSLPILKNL